MSLPAVLANAFGVVLKPIGFKRKASTWYRTLPEVIQVVNLQKADYCRQYYVNVALWPYAFGMATLPKEYQCPVRFRWSDLVGCEEKELNWVLDFDDVNVEERHRTTEIARILEHFVVPFLDAASSLEGLRSVYRSTPWLENHCWAVVRPLLRGEGMPPPSPSQ